MRRAASISKLSASTLSVRGWAVAAAAMLAGALAGCGGDEGSAGSGGSSEPLKIGVLLPTSGVYAQLGDDITSGMKLYFDAQRNQLAGRRVELIVEDSEANPQVAVQKARTLIEREDVDVLTGAVSTAVAYAVEDLATRARKPFVVSLATGNDLTRKPTEYVFRTSMSSWQHSAPMGQYLVDEGVQDVLLFAADYAGGQEHAEGFREGFTEAGGNIVDEVQPPLATADYSPFLPAVRQADPDAVWAFFAGSDSVRFVQQYDQIVGDDVPLYGNGSLVANDTLTAQKKAALGVQTINFYAPTLDTPENREWAGRFEEEIGRTPSFYSVSGYDAAWLIGEAIKATEGNTEDVDALVAAMEDVEFQSPRGPLTLDENHNPVQNMYIREARMGDGGELENVVVETIENVEDPGPGAAGG